MSDGRSEEKCGWCPWLFGGAMAMDAAAGSIWGFQGLLLVVGGVIFVSALVTAALEDLKK